MKVPKPWIRSGRDNNPGKTFVSMAFIVFVMLVLVFSLVPAALKTKKQTADRPAPQRSPAQRTQSPREGRILNSLLSDSPGGGERVPTDIEKRRMARQEESIDKSRIHQNIKNKQEITVKERHEAMEEIRDLIVCGYPVHIPGDRDFLKEAQDFLVNLTSDSIFL